MEVESYPERSTKNEEKRSSAILETPKVSVTEAEVGQFQVSLEWKGKKVTATAYSPLNAYRKARVAWAQNG